MFECGQLLEDNPSQFPRPENSSMDPDYNETSSDTAYHDSTNEMNFLRDCLIKELWARMGKVPQRGRNDPLIDDVEVCEDEDALQQLKKSEIYTFQNSVM